MAKNPPKHPLERWAQSCVEGDWGGQNPTKIFFETSFKTLMDDDKDPIPASVIRSTVSVAIFADELTSGRGQIVRLDEQLAKDVLDTETDENVLIENAPHMRMPWPMFAIELPKDEDYQAVVITTTTYLIERVHVLRERFDIDAALVTNILVRMMADDPMHTDTLQPTIGLVPSESLMRRQAVELAEVLVSELEQRGSILRMPDGRIARDRDDAIRLATRMMKDIALYDMHRVERLLPGHSDSVTPTLSLFIFVCAENSQMRTVFKPGPEPKNRAKAKKRSKATIHECGFTWTEAYREYRDATKSANKLGGSVRPHIRRGHYHRFWTGPRDGERKLVTHWIPPTLVKGTLGPMSNQGHRIRAASSRKDENQPPAPDHPARHMVE